MRGRVGGATERERETPGEEEDGLVASHMTKPPRRPQKEASAASCLLLWEWSHLQQLNTNVINHLPLWHKSSQVDVLPTSARSSELATHTRACTHTHASSGTWRKDYSCKLFMASTRHIHLHQAIGIIIMITKNNEDWWEDACFKSARGLLIK